MHCKCAFPDDGLLPFPGPESVRSVFFALIGLRAGRPRRRPSRLLSCAPYPTREERVVQVVLGELTVRAEREGADLLRVRLTGKSASRDAARELQPVFERLLQDARDERRSLALHFERLEYFNSSTIAALIQFIRTAHQAGVWLLVRYDAKLRWQAMSFDALRRALKAFETAGGPALRFDGEGGGS